MMEAVTFENKSRYNFKMSLERNLGNMVKREEYDLILSTLEVHSDYLLNTMKYFGNDKISQEILCQFSDLVEYHCLPFHKCSYYYEVIREVGAQKRTPYPSDNYCIDLIQKLINVVKVQYKL